ncbi:hypothetical protein [Burkholderia seminalis]|uniref:hypothetical protein n=1 Tax=Burkholderia seminalis TaxID=488731 RepID=UPI000F5B1E2C|nr:hypothetical protein [Burkholderia seminalis]
MDLDNAVRISDCETIGNGVSSRRLTPESKGIVSFMPAVVGAAREAAQFSFPPGNRTSRVQAAGSVRLAG